MHALPRAPRWLLASLLLALPACASQVGGGDDLDPGGGGDGSGGDGDGDDCAQTEPIEFTPGAPPDLLLVVDKSGSMDDPLSTGDQKWSTMRNALKGAVNQYAATINFGLMLYPQDDECAPGAIRADIAVQNNQAIGAALDATNPDGGTPTHSTMQAALSYFQGRPSDGAPRFALLATDGEPNCGSLNDPNEPTVNESIDAIGQLRAAGINTFVLGFGGNINTQPDILAAMAEAGGTDQFYAADSPAQLAAALDAIADEVGLPSCSFTLDRVPNGPEDLTVLLDGAIIELDPAAQDGWGYDAASNTVTFFGTPCDAIQSGSASSVRVEYACGGVVE